MHVVILKWLILCGELMHVIVFHREVIIHNSNF